MDYTLVIGLIVVVVVGFFAYQWISKRASIPRGSPAPSSLKAAAGPRSAPAAGPVPTAEAPDALQQERATYPRVEGQTQAEMLTKEPNQRREPSSQQGPVMNSGEAPAQFDEHLRHPEQLFHQPQQGQQGPSLHVSDMPSGRAASQSTPLGPAPEGAGQQGFSPEMAQNGGALVGSSLFAFDGMEPTGFTSF